MVDNNIAPTNIVLISSNHNYLDALKSVRDQWCYNVVVIHREPKDNVTSEVVTSNERVNEVNIKFSNLLRMNELFWCDLGI